ncbi:MAG: TlpA family protein disulfide reductase [Gammaproteobacteria bacterium]|nr:TlpA family protein disulfide reductase [Gammaproteobacteria bacterium]
MTSTLPVSRKVMVVLLMVAIGLPATSSAQPDLVLRDLEGVERRLSDHRGQWVVLNFWATWCPPCVYEMPELSKFHELHKNKDAFVWGVDFEKIEPAALEAFLKKVKVRIEDIDAPLLTRGLPSVMDTSSGCSRVMGDTWRFLPFSYV